MYYTLEDGKLLNTNTFFLVTISVVLRKLKRVGARKMG